MVLYELYGKETKRKVDDQIIIPVLEDAAMTVICDVEGYSKVRLHSSLTGSSIIHDGEVIVIIEASCTFHRGQRSQTAPW